MKNPWKLILYLLLFCIVLWAIIAPIFCFFAISMNNREIAKIKKEDTTFRAHQKQEDITFRAHQKQLDNNIIFWLMQLGEEARKDKEARGSPIHKTEAIKGGIK